jgi:hypothetical protein
MQCMEMLCRHALKGSEDPDYHRCTSHTSGLVAPSPTTCMLHTCCPALARVHGKHKQRANCARLATAKPHRLADSTGATAEHRRNSGPRPTGSLMQDGNNQPHVTQQQPLVLPSPSCTQQSRLAPELKPGGWGQAQVHQGLGFRV